MMRDVGKGGVRGFERDERGLKKCAKGNRKNHFAAATTVFLRDSPTRFFTSGFSFSSISLWALLSHPKTYSFMTSNSPRYSNLAQRFELSTPPLIKNIS
jgi:hypothetical protein